MSGFFRCGKVPFRRRHRLFAGCRMCGVFPVSAVRPFCVSSDVPSGGAGWGPSGAPRRGEGFEERSFVGGDASSSALTKIPAGSRLRQLRAAGESGEESSDGLRHLLQQGIRCVSVQWACMDGRFRFGIMHVYPESVFPVVGLADGRLPAGGRRRTARLFPVACLCRPAGCSCRRRGGASGNRRMNS